MGRRLVLATTVLAAAMLSAKCNSNQAKPIVNKSPAVETIQGKPKATSMSEPVEKKKKSQLSTLVPKPTQKADASDRGVTPVDPNPFVASKEDEAEKGEKKPMTEDEEFLCGLKCVKHIDTKRSDYKPWEDKRTGYEVDHAEVRVDTKSQKKK